MKKIKEHIKIATIIILAITLNSCNAFKSMDIGNIENVNFKGIVNNKVSLELLVPVTNPNKYKIKIKSMDLDVTINGNYLGKMKNTHEITIPANSDEIQKFPVDIYVKNIMTGLSSIYKLRKAKHFEMQVEGTIGVKALLRKKTIKVSEKQHVSI